MTQFHNFKCGHIQDKRLWHQQQSLLESTAGQVQCLCLRKQPDKPVESCSIKYVHNYVEQKVSNAVTSGELDARVVYS